jgi:gamma-glutamylcyclotransferase (GGCT)/AIG2-like uncharacterized protein YtfP
MPSHTLFVYGTLLQGQAQGGLVAGPRRPARLPGTLWRVPAGYPALVPDPAGPLIHGELVQVDDAQLAVLDVLERVANGLYTRRMYTVQCDGKPVSAFAYTVTQAEARARRYKPLTVDDWRRVSPRGRT